MQWLPWLLLVLHLLLVELLGLLLRVLLLRSSLCLVLRLLLSLKLLYLLVSSPGLHLLPHSKAPKSLSLPRSSSWLHLLACLAKLGLPHLSSGAATRG